jgi:hypothetical protein
MIDSGEIWPLPPRTFASRGPGLETRRAGAPIQLLLPRLASWLKLKDASLPAPSRRLPYDAAVSFERWNDATS